MATYKKAKTLKCEDNIYEFIPPSPTETYRGGIIASSKSDTDTQEVKLGTDGKLYVPKIPTKTSELTNDNDIITKADFTIDGDNLILNWL